MIDSEKIKIDNYEAGALIYLYRFVTGNNKLWEMI